MGSTFDYVELIVTPELPLDPSDVSYILNGGKQHRGRMVRGTVSFAFWGKVARPSDWVGYSCRVNVNDAGACLDGEARDSDGASGYVGGGSCEPSLVNVDLVVLPEDARGLLTQLRRLARRSDERRSIRVDMESLRVITGPFNRGAVGFVIPRVYF